MVFRILENPFAIQKIKSRHFYLCPIGSTFPTSLSSPLPPRQREIAHSLQRDIFSKIYFPQQRRERKQCACMSAINDKIDYFKTESIPRKVNSALDDCNVIVNLKELHSNLFLCHLIKLLIM